MINLELHPALVREELRSPVMGNIFFLFDTVGSTNDICSRLGGSGFSEGTVVAALNQSKGRGRKGRAWFSASGKGLVFSILLRPGRETEGLMTLFSYSVIEALERIGIVGMMKWPNDIYIGERKAGGILAEGIGGAVTLGAGLNINETREDFPPEISPIATSLRMESGRSLCRRTVLCGVLDCFGENYQQWKSRGLNPFLSAIRSRLLYLGDMVTVTDGRGLRRGRMAGISDQGYLHLETGSGVETFHSGELSLERGE
ncbi:MAG: biotin--[acetyl-CoA-carboxylase] ligase [Candidatus Latescibacteria bacterium]|nr:biotin--[acetyl-CoA-carboxylase] ligase [bacterium]MBD3423683.1 biotin--[acetyl-CoA-carboxylase] ligase [Candidatus Latescibacterota bacterium]